MVALRSCIGFFRLLAHSDLHEGRELGLKLLLDRRLLALAVLRVRNNVDLGVVR